MLTKIKKVPSYIKNNFFQTLRRILLKINIYVSENLMFDKNADKVFQVIVNPDLRKPTTEARNFFGNDIHIQTGDFRSHVDESYIEEISRIVFLKKMQSLIGEIDFYDIGANYGMYSILLDDRASLTLVEPNPFVTHCLKRSFFNKKIACCL